MAFVKKTVKNGKAYYDLVESVRVGGKPKHRFIAHLGTRKPGDDELVMINMNLKGNDRVDAKKPLLTPNERKEIDALNRELRKRIGEYSELEMDNWKKRFSSDFIFNTNAIEGSTITREETELILETGQMIEGKSLREIYEVDNMSEAIRFMNAYKGDISEKFIKVIHAIVQKNIDKETLGKYKRVPNYIGKHYPTHPIFVERRMREELSWYSRNIKKVHPFELALLMHLKIVMIHPFTDGNGRVARLIQNFILQKNNFVPMIYSNENKMQYYVALSLAGEGKLRPFVEFTVSEWKRTYKRH